MASFARADALTGAVYHIDVLYGNNDGGDDDGNNNNEVTLRGPAAPPVAVLDEVVLLPLAMATAVPGVQVESLEEAIGWSNTTTMGWAVMDLSTRVTCLTGRAHGPFTGSTTTIHDDDGSGGDVVVTLFTLRSELSPSVEEYHAVACEMIGGVPNVCGLHLSSTGEVSVHIFDSMLTQLASDTVNAWVALDGVCYGGWHTEVSVSLQGRSSVDMHGGASLNIGA